MEATTVTVPSARLSNEELENLPADVVGELRVWRPNAEQFALIERIKRYGGIQTIDQIIVRTWKETNVLVKRTTMAQRLNMLVKRRLLQKPHSAIYAIPELPTKTIDAFLETE